MPRPIPAAAVNNAKEYRTRAERLRHEAEVATDPNVKKELLELARRFDNLATVVERTARRLSRGDAPRT